MEDDIEIEFLPPTPSGGLANNTPGDRGAVPRPLLNPERLRSQGVADDDQAPGKDNLAKELDEEIRATKSFKKGDKVLKDFSVMLNLTDVSYGVKGHNKYYRIQILHANEGFVLYTQWGRVGAKNPQSKNEEFDSKTSVIKAFKKKFWDKTHNDWEDRENFQPQTGKYVLINLSEDGMSSADSINKEIQRLNRRNQEIKQKIETKASRLDPRIFNLMKIVWDINRMNRTLKEMNFDTEKYPLGRLTAEQIQKGYRILSEIQNVLMQDAKQSKFIELTNEFYTNIPQSFGMKLPPKIDNVATLREKVMLLDVLKELEVANKYINLALFQKDAEAINPLDSFFELLNIKLNLVSPSDNAYVAIQNCLQISHGPTHNRYSLSITDVLEIQRKGENERFFPFRKLNNRALLWHGSRVTNYVGILSEGLKIAPPDAPVTGYMFGKGVYFADVPSKSAQYCSATPENPEGILMLCEVALGDMYRVYKAKQFKRAPKYFHSVYGVGQKKPTNENRIYFEDGLALEAGEVKDNKELENTERGRIESELKYNEFIVYDVGQIRIRYLVRVRFNFKNNHDLL